MIPPNHPRFLLTQEAFQNQEHLTSFWKGLFQRSCLWNLCGGAGFFFSKKIGIGIWSFGILDIAYRILFRQPKAEQIPQSGRKRALRQVARVRPEVLRRYAPNANVGYGPMAVDFEQFPQLQIYPADTELLANPPQIVPSLDWSNQNLSDEQLAKLLMDAEEVEQLDLSGNAFTGVHLHAGFALPTTRLIMRNLDQLQPDTLRLLETYPNLVELDLSGSRVDNQALILGLYKIPPQLQILRLDRCMNFAKTAIKLLVFKQMQTLELLTLIDSHQIDQPLVQEIIDRAKEDRVKPLLVVWRDADGRIRADLSPCSGFKKRQQELVNSLSEPYERVQLHEPAISFQILWESYEQRIASSVVIEGEGGSIQAITGFLQSIRQIRKLTLIGFHSFSEVDRKELDFYTEVLDINS